MKEFSCEMAENLIILRPPYIFSSPYAHLSSVIFKNICYVCVFSPKSLFVEVSFVVFSSRILTQSWGMRQVWYMCIRKQ